MGQPSNRDTKYNFSDAYDIRSNGVGTLNLNRAVKSYGFKKKASEVVMGMKKLKIEDPKKTGEE